MSFEAFSQRIRIGTRWLVGAVLAAVTACNPFRPAFREKVVVGSEYAHYIRFPGSFEPPASADSNFRFDHLSFRIAAANPDQLVVAGCGYPNTEEVCSSNSFLVDTAHQYAMSKAPNREWEGARPIPGSDSLPNGYRQRPPDMPVPITGDGPPGHNVNGFKFLGKEYYHRGDWITALILRPSGDGKLVVLVGADKRKLPSGGVFFGDPVSDGAYGNLRLDVFRAGPEHELAAIDVDCGMATNDCRHYVTVINSRWFAVALEKDLTRAVLFDFGVYEDSEAR
jgi:hypothetical protein